MELKDYTTEELKASEFIEAVENFVKSKKEELERMIPSFVDDREFTNIVLNFYERGIRDGTQMILERMEALKEAVDAEIVEIEDNNNSMYAYQFEKQGEQKLKPMFKPFDKVLVCDGDGTYWFATEFSCYNPNDTERYYRIIDGSTYSHCLPYEGNEKLNGVKFKPEHISL